MQSRVHFHCCCSYCSILDSSLHSSHQGIYDDWPEYDAELTIAQCMKTCVYCSNFFRSASELRRHLRTNKYARKNLRVHREEPGKLNPTTPSWTPRVKIIDSDQSSIESIYQPSNTRRTRSQTKTDGANSTTSMGERQESCNPQ